jgi:hypothetical protein
MSHTVNTLPALDDEAAHWPSVELNACPFPFYEGLRGQEAIYKHPDRDEYLVSRYADIRAILKLPKAFSNDIDGEAAAALEQVLGPGAECPVDRVVTSTNMPQSDPPEHTLKRRRSRFMVEPRRLESYEPIIEGLVHEQIDAFLDRGTMEFCSEFANPLAFRLICRILGFTPAEVDVFWSKGNPTTGHGARYLSAEERAELEARPSPEDFLREQILARYENPTEDALTELIQIHVEKDGVLPLEYLVTEATLLLNAGNETTARMLASTMRLLLDRPDVLAAARADHALIPAVIEESLRYEAPTQWVTRRCVADTEIGGTLIPAGALVVLLYASANRDDERWGDDAAEFTIGREGSIKHQLAFGSGAHFCLGAPIARLEGKIALEILLDRITNIAYADPDAPIENIHNIQKRAPKELHLRFTATEGGTGGR